MSKKLLWARNGALLGLVIVLADYFLHWRGQNYLAWTDANAAANNIGQMVATIGLPAIVGFLAGAFVDYKNKKAA